MKKRLVGSILFFLGALILFASYLGLKKPAPVIIKSKVDTIRMTPTPVKIAPLSLEKIFFGDKTYLANLPQNKLITIISTGDIILARVVNVKSTEYQNFTWAFENVWPILKNADLTVVNLEAPLMKNCTPASEGMTFCGSDKHIEGLVKAGVDLVTLANNHSDNYGREGILETANLLKKYDISFTGIAGPAFLTIKNIRFAFLGYNFLSDQDLSLVEKEIAEAKNNSDIVIVFPHWGNEYQESPSQFQIDTEARLLNHGADLILGNHPHIIQPLSIKNTNLTIFAHGNFIFDQMWSEETKKGFIAKIYIYGGKVIDVEVIPIYIKDFGQPEIVAGEEKEKMIKDLYKLSLKHKSLAH